MLRKIQWASIILWTLFQYSWPIGVWTSEPHLHILFCNLKTCPRVTIRGHFFRNRNVVPTAVLLDLASGDWRHMDKIKGDSITNTLSTALGKPFMFRSSPHISTVLCRAPLLLRHDISSPANPVKVSFTIPRQCHSHPLADWMEGCASLKPVKWNQTT